METSPVLRRLARLPAPKKLNVVYCAQSRREQKMRPCLETRHFVIICGLFQIAATSPRRRLCVVEVARGQRSRPPLVKLFLQLFAEPPTQRGRDERYRMSSECIILNLLFRHCCFRVCESAVGAGTVAEHFQGGGGERRTRERPDPTNHISSRLGVVSLKPPLPRRAVTFSPSSLLQV